MNPTIIRLAISVSLASCALGASAQENFPDVPKGHWAYKEVAELRREGLLKGYPDGLFRGGRPATRYELAVAVHAAWSKHKKVADGLSAQLVDALKRRGADSQLDPKNVQIAIDRAREQRELNTQEIAALKKLVAELKPELDDLKMRIQKEKINGLDRRIGSLEKRRSGG